MGNAEYMGSNTIFSNKLLQPRQSSMIYTSSDNNHTVQNIRNENKNTIAAAVTTTTTTTTATTNSNVNNQTTWNPFGIPIPPALVWFTVMKQQINQLPITRQDVTVTHSNHDHQHVDHDATSIQTLSNSGNISITTNDHCTNLRRVGTGLGEYLFDKQTLGGGDPLKLD